MAEIVEYRVEKTIQELDLLVDFGLFSEQQAKAVLSKRQNFEYILRRRNKTKLDFLKYIRFEVNLLESIDKYRKTVIKNYHDNFKKDEDKVKELEQKILLLQAKKLADIVRSRSAHVSSLFRKLTITFQFDSQMWLAYIDFAKSRNWNTRVSALYWRLLRVCGDDHSIWLAAAAHELDFNKNYDAARGLYLRALRHFPKSPEVWAEYFKMEVRFMDVVDRRARIVFKCSEKNDEKKVEDIWVEEEPVELAEPVDEAKDKKETGDDGKEEEAPVAKPIQDDDSIISGHLPKVIYANAIKAIDTPDELLSFFVLILNYMLTFDMLNKCVTALRLYICGDIDDKRDELKMPKEFADCCGSIDRLASYISSYLDSNHESRASKRSKQNVNAKMIALYECYHSKGVGEARKMFTNWERSLHNQKLSLYVNMIQVEMWQLLKDKSKTQLDQVRSIYEKALTKFGKYKPKLWYEYLQVEYDNAKSLEDFNRINEIYSRAQATLDPSKVDIVIEKYTLLQVNSSSANIEFSDYSDIDD